MRRARWASMIVLAAVALSTILTPTTASAGAASTPNVRNTGQIAIGAIQVWRGDGAKYRSGWYDELIPGNAYSGYPFTGAFYVGRDHCVRQRIWLNPTGTVLSNPTRWPGPDQVVIDAVYGVDLRALPITHDLCQHD
jgi:hypothetical protein